MTSTSDRVPAILPNGKFFSRSGQKFFFKAMRIEMAGDMLGFSEQIVIRKRFDDLREAHTTGLILTEKNAELLLPLAGQAGLYALVEIEARPEELFTRPAYRALLARIANTMNPLRGHPALMGYLIDCPIEPGALRYHGVENLKRRLRKLMLAVRHVDDTRIVALKHRPATAGLATIDEDIVYAVMPALSPADLRTYVIRLHNLAEARPVVLEFGEGLPGQDELVACAFGLGAAGIVAPAMQPAASSGWLGIRMLSAGELLPFVMLNGSCPPKPPQVPMVSVVICAYNAERTMRQCLESLRRLDYPNYEIIIVDDGSRDRTAEIAMEFPEFRLIRQPNKGLSVARNVGMHAARGDIVAYTDSDCVVDSHWLSFMVRAMEEGGFDGCGGPNYAPHEEGWVEACVAAAPGAPCHVLVGDERAEHLAGCNMAYRKSALLSIGGFDSQFTAAGDDVDACWRMIDAGFKLGFCPSAFVWHFRRNTVKAYYGQQRGYGKAEAMLYLKYPERFNILGQIKWRGTIPGLARTVPGGSRQLVASTRHDTDFQEVRDAQLSVLKVLPLTAEWNLAAAAVLVVSLALGVTIIPALAALLMGLIWAMYYASKAPLEKCHDCPLARMLVALLAYTGPLARTIARYRCGRNARRKRLFEESPRQRPSIDWIRRTVRLDYWNEAYITRESVLERISRFFAQIGRPAIIASGWNDFDLSAKPDPWTRLEIRTADEEHGGMRLKTIVSARVSLSNITRIGLATLAAGAGGAAMLGCSSLAFALAAILGAAAVCATSEAIETGRIAYRVIEQCASELSLIPLGQPTVAARQASANTAPMQKEGSSEAAQPAGR